MAKKPAPSPQNSNPASHGDAQLLTVRKGGGHGQISPFPCPKKLATQPHRTKTAHPKDRVEPNLK